MSTSVIDSTKADETALKALEALLFGSANGDAELPNPDEVLDLFD